MKLATWNVNSLKVRLPQVLDWLEAFQPDALCLQETKLADPFFPREAIRAAGYHAAFAGQKTYNGVAILSRQPPRDITVGMRGFDDPQQRLIAASIDGVRVVCGYFPNGQSPDSDKYVYKLQWLAALTDWLREELQAHPALALLGDYNIAPEDRDVHDPAAWQGKVLVSPAERAAFQELLGLGLADAFRLFEQETPGYTWWDYRTRAFRRDLGLRIDHILLTRQLAERCRACTVDRQARAAERPSDHAPVIAELA